MEGQCSETGGSGTPSPLLQANTSSQLTADLSSYEDACERDPELQSFDATLHERTNHVIKILADGVKLRSLGSFKEVTNCLLEMNQDVVKVILESEDDIWDNPELFGLVKEYFKSNVETMEFYKALGRSLERAKNSQSIIQLAIKQDEEEVEMKDMAVDKKFEKTLEGLQKSTAAGNPFTPQFFALFKSVHEQQVSMLKKLVSRTKKLDEKLKSMETWRRVSNVLFVSAFVSVLIFSVLAAAVAAPPVVIALASAMAVPIGSVGKWCSSLWIRYEKALEEEKVLVTSLEVGTRLAIKDMESIRALVNKFHDEIESLLKNADIAIREEDAVKLGIDDIKRMMAVFMERIEDLAARAGTCQDDIIAARKVVVNKTLEYAGQ
ncbi:hypothetical protein OIU76_024489 [Salix suchowensis]|nr:hypothetical protein OIU76_024489 [Salix suchowensis]KAJ6378721.1 hypothetical protein OIU78_028864 [Salix suchowensis]